MQTRSFSRFRQICSCSANAIPFPFICTYSQRRRAEADEGIQTICISCSLALIASTNCGSAISKTWLFITGHMDRCSRLEATTLANFVPNNEHNPICSIHFTAYTCAYHKYVLVFAQPPFQTDLFNVSNKLQ